MPEKKFLLVRVPEGETQELGWRVPIGRSIKDGIKLIKKSSSRRHAVLTLQEGQVFIEDTKSVGGTYVNLRKIEGKIRLSPGDRISFDNEEFEFRLAPTEASDNPDSEIAPGAWADVDWDHNYSDGTERFSRKELNELYRKSAERAASRQFSTLDYPCLVFSTTGAADKIIPLTPDKQGLQEWIVGRHEKCEIRLNEQNVSECHAKLVREGQKWKLMDAITANGTYVNELRIRMAYLSSGDRLRFGSVDCIFFLPSQWLGTRSKAGKKLITQSIIAIFGFIIALAACTAIYLRYFRGQY